LGPNLRRIFRSQVANALAIVRGELDCENSPVHRTRKHLKKARAALQLLAGEYGAAHKKMDHALRDAGRLISEVRDAEVRLQTVRELQEITLRQSQRTFRKTEQLLLAELEHFIAAFAGWQTQAEPLLQNLSDEIDRRTIEQVDCKAVRCVVQHSYKLARSALARAQMKSTPENFHDFRSKAKRLLYQLRILQPINPLVIKTLRSELDSLAEVLGRSHDLHFLGERLRRDDASTSANETHALMAVISTSELELQKRGVDLAEHFFDERPRDFGNRLAGWLEHWRDGQAPTVADALICDDPDILAE